MTDVPMFPVVGHDVETCAGGGRVAPGAAGWLGFAAAPTFRIHGEQLVTRNSRWTPLRRLEINLSHGAAWKALISRYITVIPLIGDEPCIAMQSMSGWPLKKPVHSGGAAGLPCSRWHLGRLPVGSPFSLVYSGTI